MLIICERPILLIFLFPVYVVLTLIAGFVALIPLIIVSDELKNPSDALRIGALVVFFVIFAVLAASIWLDYLYLVFRSFGHIIQLRGDTRHAVRVVQLIAATVFCFAVAHYYVQLFSNNHAYSGMHAIAPPDGWRKNESAIDRVINRLTLIPPWESVVDCLYFSAVTVSTVGYGDMHPVSPIAKLVTGCQIIIGFTLIVLVLGWAIGSTAGKGPAATEQPNQTLDRSGRSGGNQVER